MRDNCTCRPLLKQLCGVFPMICLYFSTGYVIGLQTINVPNLRTTSLKLTEDQESWLASISILMMIPSDGICGPLSDVVGRKPILVIALLPQLIACVLLYCAEDYIMFFLAYLIAGFWGFGVFVSSNYVAEITSPKHRSSVLNTRATSMSGGFAAAHGLGNLLHWKTLTLCGMIANSMGLVIAIMLPESPAWLASKGKFDECKKVFTWFRGNEDRKELAKLIQQQNYVLRNKRNVGSLLNRVLKFLRHASFFKAFMITTVCLVFIEMCGRQMFVIYAFDVIGLIVNDKTYIFYCALGLDLADFFSTSLSCFIVKKVRKRLLVFGVGTSALLLLLVIILLTYFQSVGYLPARYSYLTLVLFSIYFALLNMAVLPNLWAVPSEIYPLSHRAMGATITGVLVSLITFSVTKLTPSMLRNFNMYGALLLNFVVSASALLYLYCFMPDTDNKSLQDIEEEMENTNFQRDSNQIELAQNMLEMTGCDNDA